MINRAPVLTLWASVVAECLGFEQNEALTFGRAVARFDAYSKGMVLGLFQPSPKEVNEKRKEIHTKETVKIDLLHRDKGNFDGNHPSNIRRLYTFFCNSRRDIALGLDQGQSEAGMVGLGGKLFKGKTGQRRNFPHRFGR